MNNASQDLESAKKDLDNTLLKINTLETELRNPNISPTVLRKKEKELKVLEKISDIKSYEIFAIQEQIADLKS